MAAAQKQAIIVGGPNGEDIVVETTLSGKSFRNVLQEMKQRRYYVSVQCIFLKSPESHLIRVAERVRGGGHHVPDDDVIRRFTRSLRNFWHLYRPLADKWDLFYNDERRYVHVALGDPGAYLVIEEDLFDLFRSHAS